MKLGLDTYSTRNAGLDPIGTLGLVADLGLQGALFDISPFTSFRADDLRAIRDFAAQKNLYLEMGMGSIFRWHPMAEKGRQLLADAGYDMAVSDGGIVIHHLQVARQLGCRLLRCVAGNLFTRDEGHDMAAMADDTVRIMREACPAAQDMGLQIALENHADFTVRELAAIWSRVNSPALGFTLDTANLGFDLDEPLRLARILVPFAWTTHFKNYRVVRTGKGLALENCALGDGEIDVRAIAQMLAERRPEVNLNIEIHSQFAPFTLDILDPTYFGRHPAPPGDGLAWYLTKAWSKEISQTAPVNLPDGKESWTLEFEHLKQSIQWARHNLSHILSI